MKREAGENGDPIDEPKGRTAGSPRAPIRTLRILELVAESGGNLTLNEVSARLAIPRTSAFSLLKPLVALGYLEQRGGRYGIGPMTYRLTLLAGRTSYAASIRPALEALSSEIEESVSFAMLDHAASQLEYVETVEFLRPVRYVVAAGERRPLYAVSGGLVLLAWQDQEWLDKYLASLTIEAFTGNTVRSKARLVERLSLIREEGVCVANGEYSDDVIGVAAPVFCQDDVVAGVVCLGLPAARGVSTAASATKALLRTASELSSKLTSPC